MQDPFLGQVLLVPYNFAPQGWALCNGQLLAISQNTALFSLLGVNYGGDGRVTFALPDLRGRVPISAGQGPGLGDYPLADTQGIEQVTLTSAELATHTHPAIGVGRGADQSTPVNNAWGNGSAGNDNLYAGNSPTPDGSMSPLATASAGGNQPHENRQPLLTLNYIIALAGIYPPRE